MIERIAVGRYAQVLLEIAAELNKVDEFEEELKWLDSLLKANPKLFLILKNPLVQPKKKKEIVDKVFSKNINLKLKNFLYLLIDKRRVEILEGVLKEYQSRADTYRGVVKAEVQSAIELSEQKIEEIKKTLESKIKKTIKIEAKVFPKIIGGLIIYIGSSIIDRSIMGRLKVMREKLLAMEGM